MAFTTMKLTTFGQNIEAKSHQGKVLQFTRVAIGDGLIGNGSMVNRTALVSERLSVKIDGIVATEDATQAAVVATLDNSKIEEGFLYRELALLAQDPDTGQEGVYLYDNAGEECEFLDTRENGTVIYERIKIIIRVAQSVNITFEPSGNPLYLDAQDVADMIEAHNTDLTAHSNQRYVIATRSRDPGKPAYGLGGGGDEAEMTVALETSAYSGGTEVSVIVDGEEYDADNLSANGDESPDGTLIIKKLEE